MEEAALIFQPHQQYLFTQQEAMAVLAEPD
jgi:hypothetical protein